MAIQYAVVIAEDDQVESAALVGKLIHEATSIYHSFMVFDGPRQLHEADLVGLVDESSGFDNPQCVVIAVLSPFDATPFPDGSTTVRTGTPSAETAFLLGYLQGRLPKSHVLVIRDSTQTDFWIDPQIRTISPRSQDWRLQLCDALSEIGVEIDQERTRDVDY